MTARRFTVTVDYEKCQAHGMCPGFAPDVFELRDEDDMSAPTADSFRPELREGAELAAQSCPEIAITVQDA